MKICGIYKITNTITGDFYIGSSKDIKRRWKEHEWPSAWKRCPNNPMYQDMKNYGTDKFEFQVIEEVEESFLKEKEQQFIEILKPSYNNINAKGFDFERYKEYQEEYRKTDKSKEYQKQYQLEYENQLCLYNSETLTLSTLRSRFRKAGIPHPVKEAKKYLIGANND